MSASKIRELLEIAECDGGMNAVMAIIALGQYFIEHAERFAALEDAAERVCEHSGSAHRAVEQSGLRSALDALKGQ